MKKSRAVVSLIVYVLILGLLGYTAIFGVGSSIRRPPVLNQKNSPDIQRKTS